MDCGFLLAILTNGSDYPDISVGDITLTFRLDNAISFPKQPSSAFDFPDSDTRRIRYLADLLIQAIGTDDSFPTLRR